MLSCVIPTLNAAASLERTVACLGCDVVVADGGSRDGTPELARRLGARVVTSARGRGVQLAAGIAAAHGEMLLLLHADTVLLPGWQDEASRLPAGRAGYFRFRLDTADPRARRLERLVAWRGRRLGLPYGDQGLLLSRALLDEVGGMRPLPLMEDVDLVRRLRGRLWALGGVAFTSAARFEREGYLRRPARNLACLSLYMAGVPPRWIRVLYG